VAGEAQEKVPSATMIKMTVKSILLSPCDVLCPLLEV
jgi:hypothetical protein